MTRITFTDGWSFREPMGPFAALQGASAEPRPVRLPHDAMRDAERRADVPSKGASAYFPPVDVTYLKTFDVPQAWADKLVHLEIQGAYAHAMVFVNDDFAGNRANGYARFFVDLTPYLRVGQTNQLRIELRSGQDSRWYSGAGLHRPVVLHVSDLVDIVPDGVRITTVRVEDDQAVVEVATEVRNASHVTATRVVSTVVRDAAGADVEADTTPITVTPGQTSVVRQRLYVQAPALWSVDHPNLYGATVSLVDSEAALRDARADSVVLAPQGTDGESRSLRGWPAEPANVSKGGDTTPDPEGAGLTESRSLRSWLAEPANVSKGGDTTPESEGAGLTESRSLRSWLAEPANVSKGGDITPESEGAGLTESRSLRSWLAEPANVSKGGDTHSFGIRTVTVDPRKGLRINGEPVLLRGACIHHDNGPLGAAAIGRAEERRIELLKAAGFNAIRAAHNPVSAAMLDACDRLGMLVMDELTDMWVRGKSVHDYALDFPQSWASDVEALVAKDYNHPSVVMYSLGNEIAEVGTPHGAVLARAMAEKVRSLDPTRLVTNGVNVALAVMDEIAAAAQENPANLNETLAMDMGQAMNQMAMSESATRRTAESHSVLDVVGLNYAEGRYELDRDLFPHRVLVGSETFGSQIGRLWPMVEASPNVIGDFTWTGWDYLGEVGIGATSYAEDASAVPALEREFPYLTAWCADLDLTGFRRPISYYRGIVFGLRTEPYLAARRPERHDHTITMQSPWAWSDSVSSWTWPGFEGRPVTVEVYADADEVALLRDGSEVTRAVVGTTRPKLAVLETVYDAGELTAVAYTDGIETGRSTLRTVSLDSLSLTALPDRTTLRDDDTDLSYIALEFVADGVLVTVADRPVTVEVSGAGVLAGMCSANPKTTERFDAATWSTFDGRALAVVRPTGPGTITVTCTAEGLPPVTIELEVVA